MKKNSYYWWLMYVNVIKDNIKLEQKIKEMQKRIVELERKISQMMQLSQPRE
jgi:hypothetical protein